jgi:hypothetical protein
VAHEVTALLGFIALFPGLVAYHYLVAVDWITPFAGGTFGVAALPLAVTGALALVGKLETNSGATPAIEFQFAATVVFLTAWTAGAAIFLDRPYSVEAVKESAATLAIWLAVFFVASNLRLPSKRTENVRAASSSDHEAVRRLFLTSHRLVAALLCAAVATMVQFGPRLISAWTLGKINPATIASHVVPLAVSNALLALQAIPHCISVAYRNLRGALAITLTLVFTLPSYWFFTRDFGPAGAAFTWLALQAVVAPLYVTWVDRRFLRLESSLPLVAATLLVPALISFGIAHAASYLVHESNHLIINLAVIVGSAGLSTVACLAVAIRRSDLRVLTEAVPYGSDHGR